MFYAKALGYSDFSAIFNCHRPTRDHVAAAR
jgi:hypothetical protein